MVSFFVLKLISVKDYIYIENSEELVFDCAKEKNC